jgi:hypothetical protein
MYLPKGHTAHYREDLSSKHRLLHKLKKDCNKLQSSLVSVEEFCQYTSLKIEQVETLIIG